MPVKIYRLSDRIRVQIGEITFLISPLTYHQKTEIVSNVTRSGGLEMQSAAQMAYLAIKYSVKGIEGLIDSENNPYQLSFNENGLTDECVSEIFQLGCKDKLMEVVGSLINKIEDPGIEGVKVILPGDSIETKKKTV